MSAGNPYVIGKRVLFPRWPGPIVLGAFSCHWAAVAALVRLRQPEFVSACGDHPDDLEREPKLAAALGLARADAL